jgi:hypothetical protein
MFFFEYSLRVVWVSFLFTTEQEKCGNTGGIPDPDMLRIGPKAQADLKPTVPNCSNKGGAEKC